MPILRICFFKIYIKCYPHTLSWNIKVATLPEVLSIHKAHSSLGGHSTLVYNHVNFTWDFTLSRNLYWLFLGYLMDLRISSGYIASNSKIFEWKRIGIGRFSLCVTYATTYLNGMNKFMKSGVQNYRVRYEHWTVWVRINGTDLPRWLVSVYMVQGYGPVECGTRRHWLTTRFPAWGRCVVKSRMVNDSKAQWGHFITSVKT